MFDKIFILDKSIKVDFAQGQSEQVIKICPKGKYYVWKYDDYLELDDAFLDELVTNFNNPAIAKPFIYTEHWVGSSYGDILNLEKREDGLYAHINLNQYGIELIKNRMYSYVSPSWGRVVDNSKNFYKNVLYEVSLTNIPAFEGLMPKIQEQISLSNNGQAKELVLLTENKGTNKKGGKKMPNYIQLTNLLRLSPDASEEAITSEVVKTLDSLKAKEEKIIVLEKTVKEKDEELSKRDDALKALNK
jgi:phage I-like protein